MFRTPSDYVAEAPEVVYHRVALFYYLLGIAEPINGAYFFRDALDTRNACSIYKPAFRSSAHCIASQLSASSHKAGQSSIMKVFVLFTSNTFPGFNVFLKVYYI
jgi:hypothetical protein